MNDIARKNFGDYLRSLRANAGLTQRQSAQRAGISDAYLAQIEKGQKNPPSVPIIFKLAEVYAVEARTLLQEAEYTAGGVRAITPARIEWAFRAVCDDPDFSFGPQVKNQELTPEAKALIVQIFERSTQRVLLLADEIHIPAHSADQQDEDILIREWDAVRDRSHEPQTLQPIPSLKTMHALPPASDQDQFDTAKHTVKRPKKSRRQRRDCKTTD